MRNSVARGPLAQVVSSDFPLYLAGGRGVSDNRAAANSRGAVAVGPSLPRRTSVVNVLPAYFVMMCCGLSTGTQPAVICPGPPPPPAPAESAPWAGSCTQPRVWPPRTTVWPPRTNVWLRATEPAPRAKRPTSVCTLGHPRSADRGRAQSCRGYSAAPLPLWRGPTSDRLCASERRERTAAHASQ